MRLEPLYTFTTPEARTSPQTPASKDAVWPAARTSSSPVRTGTHPKNRFSATVDQEEPEVKVALVELLRAPVLLAKLRL
jgi:hypothetical protein